MSIRDTHTNDLSNVKVGDIVDLYNPLVHNLTGESFNVTRLTPTQVIITRNGHESRYRRRDGIAVGMGWTWPQLRLRLDQSRTNV